MHHQLSRAWADSSSTSATTCACVHEACILIKCLVSSNSVHGQTNRGRESLLRCSLGICLYCQVPSSSVHEHSWHWYVHGAMAAECNEHAIVHICIYIRRDWDGAPWGLRSRCRVSYDGAIACAVLYISRRFLIYTMGNLNWFHQMCSMQIYSYDHGRKSNSNYILYTFNMNINTNMNILIFI